MLNFVWKLKLPLFLLVSPNTLDRPEITRIDRVMICWGNKTADPNLLRFDFTSSIFL